MTLKRDPAAVAPARLVLPALLGPITAKLGGVQDKLHELREENITLLEEKRSLAEKLRTAEERNAKRSHYKLVATAGGAKLPQFDGHDGGLQHYVCPACMESRGEFHRCRIYRTGPAPMPARRVRLTTE